MSRTGAASSSAAATSARKRSSSWLDCYADVVVISPEVNEGVRALADDSKVVWHKREYQSGDLKDAFIAIAATDDNTVNRAIAKEAEERNVLLNVVDGTHLCTFIAPSVAIRGDVTVAASTGGASPGIWLASSANC